MISVAQTYARIGVTPSVAQLAFAKAALGEPLNAEELIVWRECSGRRDAPATMPVEIDLLAGRKGGKTEIISAPLIVHRAVTSTSSGETHLIVSPSKSGQSTIAWRAVNAQLARGFPGLIADVKEADGKIFLHNGDVIAIASANFRSLRGPKYATAVLDEACFFYSDDPEDGGANMLPFILDSIAGGMIATAHPLLFLASTPWTKSGVMWSHYQERDSRYVFRAPTLLMNPHANKELMEKHRKDRGENFYRREYLAEFSEDSFAYIDAADADAAIVIGVPFFAPQPGVRYSMGLDPGRLRDHFGAAIAHRDADEIVVDWCREWKPGFLSGLKYAEILPELWKKAREYHVRRIASDQIDFGGIEASVPLVNGRPEFELERIMTGGQSGAALADTTRALFANRKLRLPDQLGLADEFKRLSDFLTQGGVRDIRAKRGHDDRSRACMLAIYQAFSTPAARPFHCPEVWEVRVGSSLSPSRAAPLPPPPGEWVDPQAGVDLNNPFVELPNDKWRKLN